MEEVKESKPRTRAEQLSPEKHKAIEMMLDGHTNDEISKELGMAPETISRWKRQRIFAREYNRNAKEIVGGGMALLRAAYKDACEKLIDMAMTKGGDRVQLEAVRTVIKLVKDDDLVQEFAARLEKIEQMANREA